MYDNKIEGSGRHRAPTREFFTPLTPPDPTWDPAEELAFILEEALGQQTARAPAPLDEVIDPEPDPEPAPAPAPSASGAHMRRLQDITEELPPVRDVHRRHRKVRTRKRPGLLRTTSFFVAALAAVIASAVSVLSGLVAYDPLRLVGVSPEGKSLGSWWPLLVYGPWLVASLSVLRAALHQRRAVHSWCVVLVFSCVAVLLCVVQAPRTVLGTAAAALPGVAALACFQQVVRQITLTRPPLRSMPRHRLGQAGPRDVPGADAGEEAGQVEAPGRGAGS
ncbi:hypothetical protein GCM10010313_43520 [Streptomyces violarus]|uniref:DUF2637 domain-containing protein n=1 Tax=Streptomyces violarus TaxID=67380 RepID=A0A7W5F2D3_9ACTN|nr:MULTISPECIES: hypothetical protein [Streptomyces]MBB3077507.1 hypothetical protein [Streptomyces violarus]WRU00873.1 hypothetical protein VJ737_25765 [Streptomyces sp. CGMCC 4.1772]GHD15892.1 hypothetical protein GCM10010313_43520 [Streptomyces violarus]